MLVGEVAVDDKGMHKPDDVGEALADTRAGDKDDNDSEELEDVSLVVPLYRYLLLAFGRILIADSRGCSSWELKKILVICKL